MENLNEKRNIHIPNCNMEQAETILMSRYSKQHDDTAVAEDLKFENGNVLVKGETVQMTPTAFTQLANLKKTIEIQVTDKDKELFNKKHLLSKKEQTVVWERFKEETPNESLFALVNALTFVGTHNHGMDIERRLEHQEIAGRIIEKVAV